MKPSRLSQSLMLLLPLLCIITSICIVIQQTARRDHLKKELADTEREYTRLEKRYKELRYPSGNGAPSDSTSEEHHDHDEHDHHDSD